MSEISSLSAAERTATKSSAATGLVERLRAVCRLEDETGLDFSVADESGSIILTAVDMWEAAQIITQAEVERAELLEALKLADAALSGANMNMRVVERSVRAAISKATGEQP